jgi:hypothetical protein
VVAVGVQRRFWSIEPSSLQESSRLSAILHLDALQGLNRQIVLHIASVQCCGWLEKQDLNFLFGDRAMFDAVWDDQELTFFDPNVTIPKLHTETPFHHKEQFVFDIMMVPDEWTIELHELDLLAVQFPGDSRLEMVGEKGELFLKVTEGLILELSGEP